MSYEVKVEDVEYLRHGSTGYLATLYRPQGTGPSPSWSSSTAEPGAARIATATR